MRSIPDLVADYISWLRDKTQVREISRGWHEITTPFIDHRNDMIQLFARRDRESNLITITDDGYAINDLLDMGCDVDSSERRRKLFNTTLNGFGVQRVGDSLQVHASEAEFAAKKHSLMQAILAVGDMFMLSQASVKNLFVDDVFSWLDENEIRYAPNAKFAGQSGFDHIFDAVIPKSKYAPERLLKTISNPTKERVQSAIFAWSDTKSARPAGAELYAIVNDEKNFNSGLLDAFLSYDIRPVRWSVRSGFTDQLAA